MIVIKKYIVLLLLVLVLNFTACDSKKNIDSAEANITTTESTIAEITSQENTTQESTMQESITQESTTQESITQESTTQESTFQESTLQESTSEATTEESTIQESSSTSNTQNFNSNESNKAISWSFKRNSDHSPVIGYNQGVDLQKFGAYYIGDTSQKVIYLTFDEGYENGYTPSILDTLKANNVKAAFFLTKPFIRDEPELSKRIAEEGHIVGNHTVNHPSMPDKSDEELVYEIEETARYYKEVTGYEMDKFFRPPAGEFSERTLDITNKLGYKTVFWSLAYVDWDVNNQPGKEEAYKHIMDNYHNGGIFLLHAVSQSNAEALDDIIKSLKEEGYTFASLYELN